MSKIEETLWAVQVTFEDVDKHWTTITGYQFDSLPLDALEHMLERYSIDRDRVRAVSVEAGNMTRIIET